MTYSGVSGSRRIEAVSEEGWQVTGVSGHAGPGTGAASSGRTGSVESIKQGAAPSHPHPSRAPFTHDT